MTKMVQALEQAGVSCKRTLHAVEISEELRCEVMLDLVMLGGKPYAVFTSEYASPHMNTVAQVMQYLRAERLI
jgi:hypothetical protein